MTVELPNTELKNLAGLQALHILARHGMSDCNTLLDFGCGDLYLGKLAVPYLKKNRYFAVDFRKKLVIEALLSEFGKTIIDAKRPKFFFNFDNYVETVSKYAAAQNINTFDFIVANSFFTFCNRRYLIEHLINLASLMDVTTLFIGTINLSEDGADDYCEQDWQYPYRTRFTVETFIDCFSKAGLTVELLDDIHPHCETWFKAEKKHSHKGLIK